ncbi:uncharacterized protein LOC114328074 [Diabrotica virgifera virgifera]|uniref:Uncharacterized protein LOC114328074 n=1 Tax=Diabrotica virgifera virgifera TaxID=50390 RepID=A0A6P7FCU6_DIAVI|nr:uncharacterized protein LOC114328074 [Diabrotica virgifera virgifera]
MKCGQCLTRLLPCFSRYSHQFGTPYNCETDTQCPPGYSCCQQDCFLLKIYTKEIFLTQYVGGLRYNKISASTSRPELSTSILDTTVFAEEDTPHHITDDQTKTTAKTNEATSTIITQPTSVETSSLEGEDSEKTTSITRNIEYITTPTIETVIPTEYTTVQESDDNDDDNTPITMANKVITAQSTEPETTENQKKLLLRMHSIVTTKMAVQIMHMTIMKIIIMKIMMMRIMMMKMIMEILMMKMQTTKNTKIMNMMRTGDDDDDDDYNSALQ